ncbi:hypothetical protein EVAR_87959_1 [Eumeta japonica]|uniref:Pre-C2HC domain-containing protein n=1 Tax=Eumeta variegata TaxID=151549 RepID=A0A4C1VCX2_EUMVA|nr:hypothetical protein EVAR_87959_1 [Eumeta japonica]
MFVQNKDRWTELRRRCAEKGIKFSQARNSAQGLKLQAKTVADFKNLQNLLVCYKFKFHTYSLKEEREIRVVLRGVPKEIPVDEVKEDLVAQNLPVQSERMLLLSGVKAEQPANAPYPGSVITASPTGIRPVIVIILRAALNAWATMAQRNVRAIRTQTVHPPVSYANKGPHGQLSWMPACSKRPLHPSRGRVSFVVKIFYTSSNQKKKGASTVVVRPPFRTVALQRPSVCVVCAGRRDRPRCGVAPSAVHTSGTAARRSVAAYRIVFRVPLLSFRYTTRPARRAVVESRYPTWSCESV